MKSASLSQVIRAVVVAALAYVVSEKLQMLMFAFGPSLKPIYDQLTRGWMLCLFFVWFLLLAVVSSVLTSFFVRWLWRRTLLSLPFTTVLLCGVFAALAWEGIDQLRLSHYEDVWTFSIFNLQRVALALSFPLVLAWLCSQGAPHGNPPDRQQPASPLVAGG